MEKNVKVNNRGIGICGLLTIVFVVLKLCGVIAWNWFWVCSPLIFSFGVFLCGLVIVTIIAIIAEKRG